MRTTIDIPEVLLRRVKAAAALQGKSLKDYVAEALEYRLGRLGAPAQPPRVKLPLVPSTRPGSLVLTSDDVATAQAEEDEQAAGG